MTPEQIQAHTSLRVTLEWLVDAQRRLAKVPDPRLWEERNVRVLEALFLARLAGLEAGICCYEDDDDWPVIAIQLPEVGQISYHLPPHRYPWAKNTATETESRILAFLRR